MSYQVVPSPAVHHLTSARLGVDGLHACQVSSSSWSNLSTSIYGRQLALNTRRTRRVRPCPATSAEVSRDEMQRVREENAASYQAARRVMGMLTDTMDALQNGISKREKALAVTATEIDNIIAGGANSPPRDNAEEERWKAESKILKLQARLAAMGKELEEKTRAIAALQKENSVIKERLAESLSRLMEMQKLKKEVEEREARLLALSKNITNGTLLQTALVEAEQRVTELNEQVNRLTQGIKERDTLLTTASIAVPQPVPELRPRRKTVSPLVGIRGSSATSDYSPASSSPAGGEDDKGMNWILGAGMWVTLVATLIGFQLQVTDLETELTTATDVRTALSQDIELLSEKVRVAEETRTATEARLGIELQTLTFTQNQLAKVEKELKTVTDERNGLQQQLNGVQGQLASAKTQVANLQRQVASLSEERGALLLRMDGLEGRLSDTQAQEAAEGRELADLKKLLEEKNAMAAQLEAELLDTKEVVAFLKEEKNVLGKRMEDTEVQSKQLLVSAESLKQQLEAEKVKEAELAKEVEMAKVAEETIKKEMEVLS